MSFTDDERIEYLAALETHFWSRHRPPLHLRDKVREGQRLERQSIELFLVRPLSRSPGEFIEEPIAKLTYVRSRRIWRLYWKRADNRWHAYGPRPESPKLAKALETISQDEFGCFFG